jgi:hypothetical protein
MRTKMKLILTMVTVVTRNTNYVKVALWGVAESAFGGSLESGGRFCVGAFGRNVASVAVNMFSCLIYFIRRCTFNAICKAKVAIKYNSMSLQGSMPQDLPPS